VTLVQSKNALYTPSPSPIAVLEPAPVDDLVALKNEDVPEFAKCASVRLVDLVPVAAIKICHRGPDATVAPLPIKKLVGRLTYLDRESSSRSKRNGAAVTNHRN